MNSLLPFLRTNVSTIRAVIVSEEELEKNEICSKKWDSPILSIVQPPLLFFGDYVEMFWFSPSLSPFFHFISSWFLNYPLIWSCTSLHSCSYLCIPVHILVFLFISFHSSSYHLLLHLLHLHLFLFIFFFTSFCLSNQLLYFPIW